MLNKTYGEIRFEMLEAAKTESEKYFRETLGGKDAYACGFAWVEVYPKYKGNTRQGKAEIVALKALGLEKSWNKSYQIWNPGGLNCQNVYAKEAGARAAAAVLKKYGFSAYPASRLD